MNFCSQLCFWCSNARISCSFISYPHHTRLRIITRAIHCGEPEEERPGGDSGQVQAQQQARGRLLTPIEHHPMLPIRRRLGLPIPQIRNVRHAVDMPPWPAGGANLGNFHARCRTGDDSEGHRLARLRPAHAARERRLLHARQLRQLGRGEVGIVPPAGRGGCGGRHRGQGRGSGDDRSRGHGRVMERSLDYQRQRDDDQDEGKELFSVHKLMVDDRRWTGDDIVHRQSSIVL